jgi:PhzF family phenazine biosynthesis protein
MPIIQQGLPVPSFSFQQVDVFSSQPIRGNPLAVVMDADGLSDAEMRAFANWTNLSETTFVLKPQDSKADYRVRIFTPKEELPFAGHPTLGTCHVWLQNFGAGKTGEIVQECAAGLIRIRRDGERLSFAAPPLTREGPVEPAFIETIKRALSVHDNSIVDANWIDNGPGWIGLQLRSRADVLTVQPDFAALNGLRVGLIGAFDPAVDGSDAQYEVRAFTSTGLEDPVTGSLNAGFAKWLIGTGVAPGTYVAAQGTALGRAGRVYVQRDDDDIWIGGDVTTCITGTLEL